MTSFLNRFTGTIPGSDNVEGTFEQIGKEFNTVVVIGYVGSTPDCTVEIIQSGDGINEHITDTYAWDGNEFFVREHVKAKYLKVKITNNSVSDLDNIFSQAYFKTSSYVDLNEYTLTVEGQEVENEAVSDSNILMVAGRYDLSSRTLNDGDAGAIALDSDGSLLIAESSFSGLATEVTLSEINDKLSSTDLSGDLNLNVYDVSTETILTQIYGVNNTINTNVAGVTVAENAAAPTGVFMSGGRYDATPRTLSDGNSGAIALSIDGSIKVSSSTLATEATLSTLDGKVTACNTGDVTVSVCALPTGASTEATLSTLNGKVTACDTSALATESTLDTLNTNIENSQGVDGSAAPSNTLLVGAVHSTSFPTLDDGDIGSLRVTAESVLIQSPRCGDATFVDGISNTQKITRDCSGSSYVTYPTLNYVYNGSTWDRLRGNSTGLKIMNRNNLTTQVWTTADLTSGGTKTSLAADLQGSSAVCWFISATTATGLSNILVQLSHDNTNWYNDPSSDPAYAIALDTSGSAFFRQIEFPVGFRYMRLATTGTTLSGVNAYISYN